MNRDYTKNRTGLLWQDDNPNKSWIDKINEAADAHERRLFIRPNVCYMNPKTAGQPFTLDTTHFTQVGNIDVYLHEATLKNTFFVFYQVRPTEPAVTQPAQPSPALQQMIMF